MYHLDAWFTNGCQILSWECLVKLTCSGSVLMACMRKGISGCRSQCHAQYLIASLISANEGRLGELDVVGLSWKHSLMTAKHLKEVSLGLEDVDLTFMHCAVAVCCWYTQFSSVWQGLLGSRDFSRVYILGSALVWQLKVLATTVKHTIRLYRILCILWIHTCSLDIL